MLSTPPYLVTFYALRPGLSEMVVTVHKVEKAALMAYTGTPGAALGAARTVKGEPKPDGFRIVDANGRVVLDYLDRVGWG